MKTLSALYKTKMVSSQSPAQVPLPLPPTGSPSQSLVQIGTRGNHTYVYAEVSIGDNVSEGLISVIVDTGCSTTLSNKEKLEAHLSRFSCEEFNGSEVKNKEGASPMHSHCFRQDYIQTRIISCSGIGLRRSARSRPGIWGRQ